jgi:RHS repeat-associated protein
MYTTLSLRRGQGEVFLGMNIKGLTSNSTDVNRPNKYLYNGKMMQDEMGLNWLDYGWRMYDPVLGRWHCIDQLSEKYFSSSNYTYCANNPIRLVDIDGRYFDERNGKKAGRIERRAEKKASRLESKANRIDKSGGDGKDVRARASELRRSASDINDMRNDKKTEYRYESLTSKSAIDNNVDGNITKETGLNPKGDKVVTMFTDNSMAMSLHEGRHGGEVRLVLPRF